MFTNRHINTGIFDVAIIEAAILEADTNEMLYFRPPYLKPPYLQPPFEVAILESRHMYRHHITAAMLENHRAAIFEVDTFEHRHV
jgi:hypothetical protein